MVIRNSFIKLLRGRTTYETERGARHLSLIDDEDPNALDLERIARSHDEIPDEVVNSTTDGFFNIGSALFEDCNGFFFATDPSSSRTNCANLDSSLGRYFLRREIGNSWPHVALRTGAESWCRCCSIQPWKSCLRSCLLSRMQHSKRVSVS